jgi:hypothetical protein
MPNKAIQRTEIQQWFSKIVCLALVLSAAADLNR